MTHEWLCVGRHYLIRKLANTLMAKEWEVFWIVVNGSVLPSDQYRKRSENEILLTEVK